MNLEPLRVCQVALATVFAYQGLVPKLLGPHPDELAMSAALGFSEYWQVAASRAAGVAELCLAVAFLAFPRAAWPYAIALVLMPLFLLYSLWAVPALFLSAFSPLTTNVAVAALALVALLCIPKRRTP
jgi:hypothetical protein